VKGHLKINGPLVFGSSEQINAIREFERKTEIELTRCDECEGEGMVTCNSCDGSGKKKQGA